MRWLFTVPGNKKNNILVLTIVQAMNGASGVLYALLLHNIVDAAVYHDRPSFWYGVIGIVALVAAQLAMRAVIRWLNELTRAEFENIFKQRLYSQLLYRDYAQISAVHSGSWLNRLTNDTVVVADNYVDILPGLIGMVVKLISALIMIIVLDHRFAFILIPGGFAMVVLTFAFRRILKKLHKSMQEEDGKLRMYLQESLSSILILRSFSAESYAEQQAEDKMQAHLDARMRKNRFSNLCNTGFGAAMNGMYLIGVCYCGYGILNGTISFGTLTAITQLIAQLQQPFANITGYLPKYYAMTASAERLMEVEKIEGPVLDLTREGASAEGTGERCVSAPSDLSAANQAEAIRFYQEKLDSIHLQNVSYTYYSPSDSLSRLSKEGMEPALQDYSLSIKKGEFVALSGKSGCGKTTALKLLMGALIPDSGSCYVEDTKGNHYGMDALRKQLFAYVPQGNQLMSGSIRSIIGLADPSNAFDDEKTWKALETACADQFVMELEQGIDTVLGERGLGLSEGQMQRIAVARAIYSERPILLLDEATSALDAETEGRLLRNLRRMTERTVVIVTHRETVMRECDRVVREV